jgi:hypothetical protein
MDGFVVVQDQQLGMRRRRRAVPVPEDPILDENDSSENDSSEQDSSDNDSASINEQQQQQQEEGTAPRMMFPPPQPRRVHRFVPPRRRGPPSDTTNDNDNDNHDPLAGGGAIRGRNVSLSQVYCWIATLFALLAILAATTPASWSNTVQQPQQNPQHSQSWTSVEQVARAAAVGVAAKRGQTDPEDRDLLQSIQTWWNAHSNTEVPLPVPPIRVEDPHPKDHPSNPFVWLWRPNHNHNHNHNNKNNNNNNKEEQEPTRSRSTFSVPSAAYFWKWVDPALLHPSVTTPTDIIDKILTSTPRLLAIANFLLAMTYLLRSAVAAWFLGQQPLLPALVHQHQNQNNQNPYPYQPMVDWSTPARERMGGFLVFKLLLISAVVAPDTLDLLILLTWYTLLSCLRSLDHLAHATTTHLSALGQPPRPGVVQLLFLVLVCNSLAAATCVALFHAAGWGMVVLLTCDCALLAADVVAHILKQCHCVLEDLHSQTIQALEARQLLLHTTTTPTTTTTTPTTTPTTTATASDEYDARGGGGDGGDGGDERENDDHWIDNDEEEENQNQNETDVHAMSPDEIQQESRRLDRQMEVLDLAHARRLAILESAMFGLELLCHLLTVAHFCHIWSLHGVQFTLIDGVLALHLHSAISGACKKIAQRRNIHSIARDLQGLFPNASDQELRKASLAGDVCAICLGTMGPGGHVKKVRCGHLYHTHCLREVVERAQSIQATKCPLCRASVLDGRRAGADATTARSPPPQQPPPQPVPPPVVGEAVPPPPPIGAAEHALFRFSTEGILPVWLPIPAFSFEVVRRQSAAAPLAPAPVALAAPQQPPPEEAEDDNDRNTDVPPPPQGPDHPAPPQQQQAQPSFLRRFLVLAGAIPLSPEEEARALAQLVDMFPQYDRSDLLRELRGRGSSEAVAEAILMGIFSGVPRGD